MNVYKLFLVLCLLILEKNQMLYTYRIYVYLTISNGPLRTLNQI